MIDGNGRSLTISPAANPTIQSLFREITTQWLSFQAHLQPPVDRILLETDFATLLTQLDDAVSAYEAEAQAKIVRLHWVQIVFLVAAFMLLAWGYHLVHHRLVWPLTTLRAAAEEIGAGKRNTAIPSLPSFELNLLGQTMEKMRREIAIYQNSLEQKVSQRTQELSTAFKLSEEIVRELEPAHLLQSVADHTRDLMQGTAVSVCLLDDNGDPNTASGFTLELVASSGSGRQHIGLRQSAARGIALPVIQQRKTVTVEGGCANCGFLHYFPGNSCVAAPLQVGGRVGLYAELLAERGHALGSFEVRDWFWERVPQVASIEAFLATVGLGLEGANLDHAPAFAARFRAAGDERAGAIEDRVGLEEVAHVRFALRWFKELSPHLREGDTLIDSFRESLPEPLSPILMRGRSIHRASRARAGLDAEFVAALEAYEA